MQPIENSEASWVPEYFDEDYLRIYHFPEERTGPEVAFLLDRLAAGVSPDAKVLDLACGQGRHAIPLARQGFRVTGLDYQENLLRVARETAGEAGADVRWVQGDMRSLPFADASFDAVVNMFTAFGYFSDEENARVIGEIARVLRPGGTFILDVANRDFQIISHVEPRTWRRLPDGGLLLNEWIWDPATSRYTYPQILIDAHGQRHFTHTVRLYTCPELTALCHQNGLEVEAVYGTFLGEGLTVGAPRMILIARKAE
ncbi:MAG: class I SAM-dependent methyltransferase [Armatimonadota bacterium]